MADEPVASALRSGLPCAQLWPPRGAEADPNDVLWVYAHQASGPGPHGGLAQLQRELSRGAMPLLRIVVLGFEEPADYGRHSYLLDGRSSIAYLRLPKCRADLVPAREEACAKQRDLLRLLAAESELECEFSGQRHDFRDLAAAVRIYLGMVALAHVPVDVALEQLSAMAIAADADGGISVRRDLKDAVIAHRAAFGNLGAIRFTGQLGRYKSFDKPPELRILMLDDQVGSHLWDRVLSNMCASGRFEPFRSWRQLRRRISGGRVFPDDATLLLDCNLGPKRVTGLELLASIRSCYPDIPIVLSSSYDDAQFALTAMRAGANDYFVKELADPQDRGSVSYYDRFRRALQRPSPREQQLSRLYRKFTSRLNQDGTLSLACRELPLPSTLGLQISLALFLLFSDAEPNSTSSWGGIFAGVPAMPNVWGAIAALACGWPRAAYGKLPGELTDLLRQAHHLPRRTKAKTASDALDLLLEKLPCSDASPAPMRRPTMPAYCPYTRDQLREGGRWPGLRPDAVPASHREAGTRAVLELARGWLCDGSCTHPTTDASAVLSHHNALLGEASQGDADRNSDLLLIDDEGQDDGLFGLLQVMLPGVECRSHVPRTGISRLLEGKTVVLLDLRMPASADGLKLLRRIKRSKPALPVLALSASTDVLDAARSLRGGAVDFIGKALPFDRSLPQCQEFHRHLVATIALCRRLGDPGGTPRRFMECVCELWKARRWGRSGAAGDHLSPITSAAASGQRDPDATMGCRQCAAPPPPTEWAQILAGHLAMVVGLHRRWWLRSTASPVAQRVGRPLGPGRALDCSVRLVPLDEWRLDALGLSDITQVARLGAVLAGGVVDLAAQWWWCWKNRKPLPVHQWGRGGGLAPVTQIRLMGGCAAERAWKLRNQALYPERKAPDWGMETLEDSIAGAIAAIDNLRETVGWDN